jgi:FMN reductase
MGRAAFEFLSKAKQECEWLDLGKMDLPLCDADACYAHPAAQKLSTAVAGADGLIVAAPVYNFDVSASAKNMIELTGNAWEDKVVGFLCAAGGMSSYMSVMAYANSLMLDFRCVIIPRFAYATGEMFDEDRITEPKIIKRVEQVAAELVRFTEALRG